MKKYLIVAINMALALAIVLLVFNHTTSERQQQLETSIETFEDLTVTMEQVAANYLQGEQGICDVWAAYIDKNDLTLEEAVSFIRQSHVSDSASAHIIYVDDGSYEGLSTRPRTGDASDYAVSYRRINLFPVTHQIGEIGEGIYVTRAYTNPMSGLQSLAFCNHVHLRDEDGSTREGLLLRIVPLSEFEEKWAFPREGYTSAEVSLIDQDGNYIIRGPSFKNTNFFEFYKSYNTTSYETLEELKQEVAASTGVLQLKDSRGEDCIVAYTPISTNMDWSIIAYSTIDSLSPSTVDWRLTAIVATGLILLFLFDLAVMLVLNNRLAAAAREAESASRAKTDFLSSMSHDIRTPMNAIIGLTTIAERSLDDRSAVSESLRKISLASDHLLTLINDILDISKVESGKLALNPLDFSIVESAENLVSISQPMVREKNIDFDFRVGNFVHEYLYADQLRLNQVLINILSNAIKYTEPSGRVEVDMREEPSQEPGSVKLVYRVADTGIGMSKEFMEQMYQPFSRQVDSRVNTIQGTGLGLAITKQMVDLMGGQIDCESELGVGTTFTVQIDIPIAQRQPDEMRLEGVEVLVVDDDEVLLATARDTLASLDAKADIAHSASEALEKVRRRHDDGSDYDVIIIDWQIPDMDGIALAHAIRSDVGAGVPILLISAYDWSELEAAAHEAGANGFISKPLFRSTLFTKINELLGVEDAVLMPDDDYSDIAGTRVLVAEDNDINWEIVSMLLNMNGVQCERAVNGQDAIDMLCDPTSPHYDLVFMDIQMPVLNGLEATRAIRALPDKRISTIPIIAMTADAFSENVTECLAAGMNGHIAKPIDLKLTLKEIREIRRKTR